MRLLITTDTAGGVWNYTMDIARGLLHAGTEVVLVSFGNLPNTIQCKAIQELQANHPRRLLFIPTRFPLEWMPGNQLVEESSTYLLGIIHQHQPDVLHSNQFCYGAIHARIPKVVVAHSDVVSWWHSSYSSAPPGDPWFAKYRSLVKAGIQGADVAVSPSQWQLDQMIHHYNLAHHRSTVIPNGAPFQKKSSLRNQQAVTAGRLWDRGKNIEVIEQAQLSIPVYIAGSGNNDAEGPAKNVEGTLTRYLGQLDPSELTDLFCTSSIYIAPSLYEPFGLAPLEAAHAGCALVLSDIGSFHELWGNTALYFNPRDPKSLRTVIESLVSDPELCASMAALSTDRARSHYGLDRCISSYLSLYRDLLNESVGSYVA